MTTAEPQLLSPFGAEPAPSDADHKSTAGLGRRLEVWLDWAGDRLNPILVKEARQSLKSRQFTVTFSLLLFFGVCWTVLGVTMYMPAVFYAPSGPYMVTGYYFILSVPLLVIVPFAAFRSLAAEQEDGTFDLLSITALSARQVVFGKLASAILQMVVYYSALAPCIAFTYLLRGLDIITIGLMLWYLFLASTLLSALGLAMATITRERHWQVLLSVVLVAGLLMAFWVWHATMNALFVMFVMTSPYDQSEFWALNVAIVTFHLSFMALFLLLAAGQISFSSDNRSTPLRRILLVQHALWFCWILYAYVISEYESTLLMIGGVVALIYWWVVGALLIGERAELSARVRRQLPQTFLGRMFCTWFNPGSGTGYFFTLLNAGTMLLVWGMLALVVTQANSWGVPDEAVLQFGLVGWCFLAAYLGVGRLLLLPLRTRGVGPIVSLLLQLLLVALGTIVPIVLQTVLFGGQSFANQYSVLQVTNPFWTLGETFWFSSGFLQGEVWVATLLLLGMALMQIAVHFVATIREVEQTRTALPSRVQADDAVLQAAQTPLKRKSPWDEPGT